MIGLGVLILGFGYASIDVLVEGQACTCCSGEGCEAPGCSCRAMPVRTTRSCCRSESEQVTGPRIKPVCGCGGDSGMHLVLGQKLGLKHAPQVVPRVEVCLGTGLTEPLGVPRGRVNEPESPPPRV